MEIKASLNKPYTDKERMNFIVQYNHKLGYEIRETEEALEAWGDTDNEKLEKAKQFKYQEALQKAYSFQQEGIVEYKNCVFEMSDSNRKNLSDTEEALKLMGEDSTIWNDKDDNLVTLTIEDIQYIRLNLILARIQKLWIEQYPAYKAQIEEASTIGEVDAIVIDYTMPVEESENIEESEGE